MRLTTELREFLKKQIKAVTPKAEIFLFGSRMDDQKKGGDIDLLILTPERLKFRQLSRIRINFYKKFGEQKLDLVNFTFDENKPFKNIALLHCKKL